MKNRKLAGLMLTPLAIIIVIAATLFGVELLFMTLLHEYLVPLFKFSDSTWDFIDAATLVVVLTPLLYFLVFRNIQASEERLRNAVETTRDAFIIVEGGGTIRGWNLAAEALFGYSKEEAIGRPLHDFLPPPRFREAATKGMEHFAATGEGAAVGKTLELAALRKDGTEFPIELSLSAMQIHGKWHATGIVRDITERKRQAERTAALLELTTLAETLDEKTLLQRGLDTVQHLTGSRIAFLHFVSEDQNEIELVTWSTDTLAHYCQADFDRHYPVSDAGIWADCIQLKRPVIINDYATEPGKKGFPERHADVQRFVSVPIFEGEQVRMIVGVGNAARDYGEHDVETVKLFSYDLFRIVQRMRAEDALKDSAAKFRNIVERSFDAIQMLDREGRFTYSSPAAELISGYKADEVIGLHFKEFLFEEEIPKAYSAFNELISGGAVRGLVLRAKRKDGTVLFLELNGSPIRKNGEIPGVQLVYRDITERKRNELEKLEAGILLKDALEDAIGAIAATLEQRDPYTAGHQRRVAQLAAAIGEEMGLAREAIEGIHFGGLIHDIGKISVPAEILGKPGRISDIEFDLIKTHADAGYQIVKEIAFPWPVADMVRQHHERLDGSGYPQGLKGEQITLEARILAVADVVEAMSANRPYRPGFGIDVALDEITRLRGAQLDPVAVDACLHAIKEKGFVFTK